MFVAGMIYFFALPKLSLRNQPPRFTAAAVGLCNSIVSIAGGSVCVSASVITIPGRFGSAGSFWPGEPFDALLIRQLVASPHVSRGAFSLLITRENPEPSVIGNHSSL